MTQVGYGDIAPHTDLEVTFIIFAMIIGASVFSYTVGNATTLIDDLEGHSGQTRRRLDEIRSFLINCNIRRPVRHKIMSYLELHLSRSHRRLQGVAEGLPATVASELKLYVFRKALFVKSSSSKSNKSMSAKTPKRSAALAQQDTELTPLLVELPDAVLARVVQLLTLHELIPGEVLLREGEHPRYITFLQSGKLDAVDSNNVVITTLRPGSFVGENALLHGQINVCTIKAQTW